MLLVNGALVPHFSLEEVIKLSADMKISPAQKKYRKACVKRPVKKTENGFQDQLSLNAGQSIAEYCNTFDLHKATICH